MTRRRAAAASSTSPRCTPSASARCPSRAYYASKAGVANVTRALAAELGPHGITVNCLAPGVFYPTPMTAALGADPDRLELVRRRAPCSAASATPTPTSPAPCSCWPPRASSYVTGQVCTSTAAGRPGDPACPDRIRNGTR